MKVLALVSGGKDSCYCILQCLAAGHEVVALGNIKPSPGIDEMDSFMYQSVGHEVIQLYAEAMDLPLFQQETKGQTVNSSQTYEASSADEVEDLYELLEKAKRKIEFEAVCSGAVLSNYQRVRVENVCSRLDLVSLAYLWQRDQKELLREMVTSNINAIVIKTASLGLDPKKVLGVDIAELFDYFSDVNKKYQLNVCGEGGEYETLTLDCPIFKKRIEILDQEIVWVTKDDYAPVAFLKIGKAQLVDKGLEDGVTTKQLIEELYLKTPLDFVQEFNLLSDEAYLKPDKQDDSFRFDFDVIKPQVRVTKKNLWITGLIGRQKTVKESTEAIMQHVSTVMYENSLTMHNIIKINVYVKNMTEYSEFNTVYKAYFEVNPPVRACVEVLLPSNVFFIMDCQATLGDSENLHVQSVSNWAPANIGPYSQGVLSENLIYTSGQIALVPGSMQLFKSNSHVQNNLIFRHIDRILKAMRDNMDLKHVVVGVCYTTDEFVTDVIKNFVDEVIPRYEPLIISVLVPGLPRDANIEWQVIADIDVEKAIFRRTEVEVQNGVVKIAECRSASDNFLLLKFYKDEEKVELRLDDIKNGLENLNENIDVSYVQIFCTSENDSSVYKLIEEFFGCCVSIVPVVRLESPDCNLVVFLYGNLD